MTKRLKGTLIALAVIALLAVGGFLTIFLIQSHTFYQDTEVVASSDSQEPWLAELSAELGIDLDPNLEKHAQLIAQRDRLVICKDVIREEGSGDNWQNSTISPENLELTGRDLPEDPIYVYTGSYDHEGYYLNVALIDHLEREYDGLWSEGVEVVFQVRPKSSFFPAGRRAVTLTGARDSFFSEAAEDTALYFRSGNGDFWITKEMAVSSDVVLDYFPGFLSGGGHFGKTALLQVWGTAFFTEQQTENHYLAFLFLLTDEPYVLSDHELSFSLTFNYPVAPVG